jgi:hypothetical protein
LIYEMAKSPIHTFRREFLAALLAVLLLSSAVLPRAQQTTANTILSAEERDLSANVKVETIKEVTAALSSAEMQGRGTMQAGGDRAAEYIAQRFAKLGLKPLGKASYMQPITFRETQFLPETSFKMGEEQFTLGPDYVVTPPYSGDKTVSGQLVFVAYGLISNVPKRDDLAGMDVKGKIVVMLEGPPKNVDKLAWSKAKAQMTIMQSLVYRGAAGLVFVKTGTTDRQYSEMADYLTRRRLELSESEEMPSFLPPFLNFSDEAAEKLFDGSGVTFAQALELADGEGFKPFSLKKSAKITIRLKKAKGVSNNVIGLLEGSDPTMKAEALVYTAHYDAYGVDKGNRVYHGAADNALGVAEMIAAAEALSQSPARIRRSIIFLAVTGEEYGGFGSSYWIDNPTWKIKQIAANLNFDGMGTEVYGPVKTLVGYGAEHSSLGALLKEVAAATGLTIIADPRPEEKSFYRSDHYYFVKRGVPGLMILGAPGGEISVWIKRMKEWEKTDYHQPTDIVRPDWNWDGPRTMAAVGVVLGFRIANNDRMPSWVPDSPFNRERGTNKPPPPQQ